MSAISAILRSGSAPSRSATNRCSWPPKKQLSPSSIGVAVSALRFLYGVTLRKDWDIPEVLPAPKRPRKLHVVPGPPEVGQFPDSARCTRHRTILAAFYAAGLRISEAISPCPADMDSRRMAIRVVQGNGRKGPYAVLSPRMLEILRDYWRRVRTPAE